MRRCRERCFLLVKSSGDGGGGGGSIDRTKMGEATERADADAAEANGTRLFTRGRTSQDGALHVADYSGYNMWIFLKESAEKAVIF